jgi:hypothetical protein
LSEVYPESYGVYTNFDTTVLKKDTARESFKKFLKKIGVFNFFVSDPIAKFLYTNQDKKNNILDIGCANGMGLWQYRVKFSNNSYHGFDISEQAAVNAKKVWIKFLSQIIF